MIPVPKNVLTSLATKYEISSEKLTIFSAGKEYSDGEIYKYAFKNSHRLLKIMAIPIKEQQSGIFSLEERLYFVCYLGEHGAKIVFPQFSPENNLYETLLTEDYVWVGYSMELVPGKIQSSTTWDIKFFRNWGQVVGKCHNLAREFTSWNASIDPKTGMEHLTWQEEWEMFYKWCQDTDVKNKWSEIKQTLESLPITQDVFGFIHNDPHIWNLVVNNEQITLLDFDVANHHWFINDIAIACQNTLQYISGGLSKPLYKRDKLLGFLRSFQEGYLLENNLSAEWFNHLDLFIAYRRILLFIVMNKSIRSKPELHRSWKNLILTQPEIIGNWM